MANNGWRECAPHTNSLHPTHGVMTARVYGFDFEQLAE
jgi:hypothetical protein